MKKTICILLSIIMVTSLIRVSASADDTAIPEGYTPIYTKNDLDSIRLDLAGKYILMNDISFSSEDYEIGCAFYNSGRGWNPIGSNSEPFSGEFNGDGHAIIGLKITNAESSYQGLFGVLAPNSTVKKLVLIDEEITGNAYIGGIAGHSYGIIEDCHVNGNITGTNRVGGLVGYLGGSNYYAKLLYSTASGTVTGENVVGGLIGYHDMRYERLSTTDNPVTVYRADVIGCANIADVIGKSDVGGLIGEVYGPSGHIGCCYNAGNIIALNGSAGGIIGKESASFWWSRVKINMQTTVYRYYEMPGFSNCYNSGAIHAKDFAGGLVGQTTTEGNAQTKTKIRYSYNVGHVISEQGNAAPIIGYNNFADLTNVYYLENSCDNPKNNTGKSRTDTELKNPDVYEEFDFENTWIIETGAASYPYATLKNVIPADEIVPCRHTETAIQNDVAATCDTDGYTGDLVCLACGAIIETGEIIIATGHGETEIRGAYKATCNATGYTGDTFCKVCNEKIADGEAIPATGKHTPKTTETVISEATCTSTGLKKITVTCSVCGETIGESTETISAIGHVDKNKDGRCDVCGKKLKSDAPTEPTKPSEEKTKLNICLYCGKVHSDKFPDTFVYLIHVVLYLFKLVFTNR